MAAKVTSPMPGKVLAIKVKVGDEVKDKDVLCILESMKMQLPIRSAQVGKVKAVVAEVGRVVKTGDVLLELE